MTKIDAIDRQSLCLVQVRTHFIWSLNLEPNSNKIQVLKKQTKGHYNCTTVLRFVLVISVMIQEDAETDCSGAISRWLGTSSLTAAAETECGAAVALAGMLTYQKLNKIMLLARAN